MNGELITSATRLREVAEAWRRRPRLALDTEFVFERTYHPRLGLIQVATEREVWLVDPLASGDLAPLGAALGGEGLKVFHAAAGDLTVLGRALGALPTPILDTQIAAALAGLGAGISYQRLVEALLGKVLAKGATRSDWRARPLTDVQLEYAVEDVVDLVEVTRRLEERLVALGRWDWALDDSRRLLDAAAPFDPQDAPSRLRGLERLPPLDRAVAAALAIWREREAQGRDLPRRWVLDDTGLLALARHRPATRAEAEAIPGLDHRLLRRDVEAWLGAIARAAERPFDPRPAAPVRRSPRERHLADRLHRVLHRRAEELGVPAEVLAPRRVVDQLAGRILAGQPELPVELAGWRERVVGAELLAAARSHTH